MKLSIKIAAVLLSAGSIIFTACKKDDAKVTPPVPITLVKEFSIRVSAANEIPANTRTENSVGSLKVFSDNSITFNAALANFNTTDTLKRMHIHTGDAVNNGPIVVEFDVTATGANIASKATNVRKTFIDSLVNGIGELYVNVHSSQLLGGLVRGQVGKNIVQAYTVQATGANEVPNPVTTTATGLAIIRITDDNKMISKVTVSNIEAGDTLRFSHIHVGASGANGPIITNLTDNKDEFGITKTVTLRATLVDTIATRMLYVNIHSNTSPGGKLRGQIR